MANFSFQHRTAWVVDMKLIRFFVLVVCFFSALSLVHANELADDVRLQLQIYKLAGLADGWIETHNEQFGILNHQKVNSYNFNLKANTSYKVIAVCDKNCKDLDLVLFDENNKEVSRDSSKDNMPIVEVIPKWTGKYNLKVVMYQCNTNPCFYGVTVLAR
jgi:hypothetical protein